MILDEVKPSDVNNGKTFAKFCQQRYGTPWPTQKNLIALNSQAKRLFAEHPDTSWQTLVQVAQWCHGKKRRIPEVQYYVKQFRYAYADGAIQLRPVAEIRADEAISAALEQETDPAWRARLMRADGVDAQQRVLEDWQEHVGS